MKEVDALLSIIEHTQLSPNEYITLICHLEGKPIPKVINDNMTFKALRFHKYLDEDLKPTEKTAGFFNYLCDPFDVNVLTYKNMWPKMLLPSGRYAKASARELSEKFKWFFSNFDYTWEEVIQATESYIDHFAKTNYIYMRTSSYFIYKIASDKIKSSTLAEWCDDLRCNKNENKSYEVDL